jgi:hypothetical protein
MRTTFLITMLVSTIMFSPLAPFTWAQEAPSPAAANDRAAIVFRALPVKVLPGNTGHPCNGVRVRYPQGREAKWPGYLLYRDSKGRTRIEYSVLGDSAGKGAITIVEIRDLISGRQYVLDLDNKIAHRVNVTDGVDVSQLRRIPHNSQDLVNPLLALDSTIRRDRPTAIIDHLGFGMLGENGVPAEGLRLVELKPGSDPTATETWMSDQNGIHLQKAFWGTGGNGISSLGMGLGKTEPDPNLFQIDPTFKVIDESGEFTMEVAVTK